VLGAGDEIKSRTNSGSRGSGNHSIRLRPTWKMNEDAVHREEAFDRVKRVFRETSRDNERWRFGEVDSQMAIYRCRRARAGGRR